MFLKIQNLYKTYAIRERMFQKKKLVHALNGVSLDIQKGKKIGIVGESGSGKTTLANAILRLIAIDKGDILLHHSSIYHMPRKEMKQYYQKVQMVFQDPQTSLDPMYTILKSLQEHIQIIKDIYPTNVEQQDRIQQVLDQVGLNPTFLPRYPFQLSGGEQQRVAIARALLTNPSLLVLDEPTSALDMDIQQQILNLLNAIQHQNNTAYIFISHNLKIIQMVCDEVYIMYHGRFVERGSVENIFNHPQHTYTKQLLSTIQDYRVTEIYDAIPSDRAQWRCINKDHYVLEEG